MSKKTATRKDPIAQNLQNPKGILGNLVGEYMALENQELNEWSVTVLNAQPQESILEVGFGPGQAIKLLLEKVPSAKVTGIDYSELMFKRASKLNQEAIQKGQVELHLATANKLPEFEHQFDRILAVNNMMYWHNPVEALTGLKNSLKPEGYIVIVFQRTTDCVENCHEHVLEELVWYHDCLSQAGFQNIHSFNTPIQKGIKKRSASMRAVGLGQGWDDISGIAIIAQNVTILPSVYEYLLQNRPWQSSKSYAIRQSRLDQIIQSNN